MLPLCACASILRSFSHLFPRRWLLRYWPGPAGASEEAVRIFCEEYAAERNRLQTVRSAGLADLEKEMARVSTDHKMLGNAIIAGVPAAQVKNLMIELAARRKELKSQLSAFPIPAWRRPIALGSAS